MRFSLIEADPAWQFATYSDAGKGRSPEQHYDCMTLDQIKALPVGEMAADDCMLLLWTIDTHIPQALQVVDAWGFTFKTVGFYWVKQTKRGRGLHTGMGHWTRANPEQCWLATRGKPKRKGKGVPRTILSRLGAHSEKPRERYARIETLIDGPYLELFARHCRTGWHQWGNEVGKLGGMPNPIDLPGLPARVVPSIVSPLFEGDRLAA